MQGVGGGLLVWAKTSFIISEEKNPVLESFNQCCSVSLPLSDGSKVALVLVYRPHNLYKSEDSEAVNNEKLCSLLREDMGPSVFIGDFNCPETQGTSLHLN